MKVIKLTGNTEYIILVDNISYLCVQGSVLTIIVCKGSNPYKSFSSEEAANKALDYITDFIAASHWPSNIITV